MCLLCGCGSGSSDPTSPAVLLPQVPLPSGRLVAFMGDSITQYWSGGPPAYPTVPITTLVPGALEEGVAGQTTQQMQARFATDVLSKNPAVVVILGGTNDLRLEPSPSIDAIAAMAESAAASGARVVICTLPPSELWLGSTFLTQAETAPEEESFDWQLRVLALDYGYTLVDYYSAMLNPDGSPNESLFIADHIHPNAAGYSVMWSVLRPALARLQAQ